ncbi:MAG: TMEM175 family protein [Parafilimonas sp.]
MNKNRLEAFSDGVVAIIITIMVLELNIPKNPTWETYCEMWPVFASYAVSFLFVGLNWANHHHLFQTVKAINNKVLWVNMLNLFVLSLVPFATASMGENSFKQITVTIYATILTLSIVIYFLLVHQLVLLHGKNSDFAKAFKGQRKSYISLGLNTAAIILSAIGFPKIAFVLLILISLAWFLPNHAFEHHHGSDG